MSEALTAAAMLQLGRDELWKRRPPLAAGCVHDLELLPIVEIRQTVVCRKCGGLDVEASRRALEGVPPGEG
jgi:hypothetical protein